jgi:hypothetical protein
MSAACLFVIVLVIVSYICTSILLCYLKLYVNGHTCSTYVFIPYMQREREEKERKLFFSCAVNYAHYDNNFAA